MTLSAGKQLGPYTIESLLGAGGMGEVYRAKDGRLDRTVAIKVLPAHLSEDRALRDRLEREARAVSSLQHPHICTLFDIGVEDETTYLVMEYLEGESLQERLKRGALPVEEALRYGVQIADALDAAHGRGVVHRDLKPGNVMLTASGVKLLDFGLAKTSEGEIDESGELDSDSPTVAKGLTEEGTLLGTLPYMAPEQLEGKRVDGRADLFAFGAVLYEMLTGRRAFEGASKASVVASVMSGEPRGVREAAPEAPASVERVLARCLAKSPDARFQTARDLGWALASGVEPERLVRASPEPSRNRARELSRLALGLLAGSGIALAAFQIWRPAVTRPTYRMSVNLPANHSLFVREYGNAFDVSPDGQRIVFTSSDLVPANGQVYVRELRSFEATRLTELEYAVEAPFFSYDGDKIGFLYGRSLFEIPVEGGVPVEIVRIDERSSGATWMADGSIVFGCATGLCRVAGQGDEPEPLTREVASDLTYHSPRALPDNRGVLLTISSGRGRFAAVLPAGAGEPRTLAAGERPFYVETGHLVFAAPETGELLGAPFDLDRLELSGAPVPLSGRVAGDPWLRSKPLAVGRSGTAAYVSGSEISETTVWVNRDGAITPVTEAGFHTVRLSPDGEQFTADDQVAAALWLYDTRRGTRVLLAAQESGSIAPWTSDGSEIAYRAGNDNIYVQPRDGSSEGRLFFERDGNQVPLSWSPDGRFLLVADYKPDDDDLLLVSRDGEVTPFASTSANESTAAFSPNGAWVAYQSDETGRREVYVKPFPGPGPRFPISVNGGTAPVWSRDGSELFYREGSAMMAVPVSYDPTFSPGRPVRLFDGPFRVDGTGHPSYDVAPDGRFLMMRNNIERLNQIQIITNLAAELEGLEPEN